MPNEERMLKRSITAWKNKYHFLRVLLSIKAPIALKVR